MLKSIISFYGWSKRWRSQFGLLQGLRVGWGFRRAVWGSEQGEVVSIRVPPLEQPLMLRARTSDSGAFEQVFLERQADFPVGGKTLAVVDAGANTGTTSAVFAHRFPQAKIIALEIDEQNFDMLTRNVSGYKNVIPVKKGLWARRTSVGITNPGAESWAFQVSESAADADGDRRIATLGVEDILEEFRLERIDLLKIDIEGAEVEVLSEGVAGWIDRVGMLAVEVHDRYRPGCSDAVRNAFAPHGLTETQRSEYLVFTRPGQAGSVH